MEVPIKAAMALGIVDDGDEDDNNEEEDVALEGIEVAKVFERWWSFTGGRE